MHLLVVILQYFIMVNIIPLSLIMVTVILICIILAAVLFFDWMSVLLNICMGGINFQIIYDKKVKKLGIVFEGTLLKRFSEDNLFIHSKKGKQKLKLIKWYKLFQLLPEKKTENREWTDASSTSGHGCEDATDKPADKQSEALQEVEVLDGVKGSPLVLSYMEKKKQNYITQNE